MKTWINILVGLLFLCRSGHAQGFVNLDFASAQLSGHGAGDFVPITNAIPGWTGYLGNNQQPQALYNALGTGSAEIAILGTNYSFASSLVIPDNAYTVVLQAGLGDGGSVSTAIAQPALIPLTAKSILFEASLNPSEWQVSVAGQNIPVFQVSTIGTAFAIYQGNISAFAGQVNELRFTALSLAGPTVNLYLDAISFSPIAVPEPGGLALAALGTLLLGFRRWRKSSK
jgi:hypothetical protein